VWVEERRLGLLRKARRTGRGEGLFVGTEYVRKQSRFLVAGGSIYRSFHKDLQGLCSHRVSRGCPAGGRGAISRKRAFQSWLL